MTTEGYERRLSAILSADGAGYSSLMGEEEALTISPYLIVKVYGG